MENSADGSYTIDVTLTGGSGRAQIKSPADMEIKDGRAAAVIEWSSPNYDYMEIDGHGYYPINTGGNSRFKVEIPAADADIPVLAETTAMSEPHMIEYSLRFDSASIKAADTAPNVILIGGISAAVIIAAAAVWMKRRRSK